MIALDPRGVGLSVKDYFAYRDADRREWDMTEALNLARRPEEDDREHRRSDRDLRERIEAFWHFIPHVNRVHYVRNGLIRFEDIAVIDEKGDSEFEMPHIFVDFHETKGPFIGFAEYLRIHQHRYESLDDLKRTKYFPSQFDAPRIGTVHLRKLNVTMHEARLMSAASAQIQALYAVDDRFDFLAVADVIGIAGTEGKQGSSGDPILIQITDKRTMPGKAFLEGLVEDPTLMQEVRQQIGHDVAGNDELRILEFKVTYQRVIDRARSGSSA